MRPFMKDTRPMTVNNLNQLVDNQLGANSYQVVRAVYDNFNYLHVIYNNLPLLQSSASQLGHFNQVLGTEIHSIKTMVEYLPILKNIAPYIPEVIKLAPMIQSINARINSMQAHYEKYSAMLDVEVNKVAQSQKDIYDTCRAYETSFSTLASEFKETMLEDYNSIMSDLEKQKACLAKQTQDLDIKLKQLNHIVATCTTQETLIAHLQASDAVVMAMTIQTDENIKIAMAQITASEALGNDESANRYRIGYFEKSGLFIPTIKKNMTKQENPDV